MRFSKLPEQDKVASQMGLKKWRVGIHEFGERGDKSRDFWVDGLWWADVESAFGGRLCALAAVAAVDWRPNGIHWRKAALLVGDKMEVIKIKRDKVAQAISEVDFFAEWKVLPPLDGIDYTITTSSMGIDAQFRFANPGLPTLVKLKTALQQLALRIAELSKDQTLVAFMKAWR